jgi:UDP-glucuronate 4-epimerase
MKILVTGAAGFIGSHVSRKLCQNGIGVIGLDNYNDYYNPANKKRNVESLENDFPELFTMRRGDILDEALLTELFASEKFDKVCHLAARAGVRPSIADPFLYEEVNIRGTLNLLEQSRICNVKNFVYASSSSVYGNCSNLPFNEELKLKPISPYASTKLTNENDAFVYSKLHGLPTIGLRFFTVYGPCGRPDMAPWLFTEAILKDRPIKKFGNGETSRDYTFIDDIVSGVVAALNLKTDCEVFNLGNSQTVSLNKFISTIEKITGKTANINQHPMQPGDVSHTYADTTKAKKLLGYNPKTSIEEGMERFIDWYRSIWCRL